MNSVRVYSITVPQVADLIGVLPGVKSAEIAAFDSTVPKALEVAESGAFGDSLPGIPFA